MPLEYTSKIEPVLKKIVLILAAFVVISGITAVSHSEEKKSTSNKMVGKVLKAEGAFLLVLDKEGRTHKFHLDETTLLNGKIKAGEAVVVESTDSGHAVSISANHPQR